MERVRILTREYHIKFVHHRDYVAAPELDSYDPELLAGDDDVAAETYEDMVRYRISAERELDRIDARLRLDEDAADNAEQMDGIAGDDGFDEGEEEQEAENMVGANRAINLEAFECPLREWIAADRTRREIQRRFREFLETYYVGIEERIRNKRVNGTKLPHIPPIYPAKIRFIAYLTIVKPFNLCLSERCVQPIAAR